MCKKYKDQDCVVGVGCGLLEIFVNILDFSANLDFR